MKIPAKTELKMTLLLFLVAGVSLLGYRSPWKGFDWGLPLPASGVQARTLPPVRGFAYTPVIDPGHGGVDCGAVAPDGAAETEYNLQISLKTELVLRFLGLKPVMTRDRDISLHDPDARSIRAQKSSDLRNRTAKINRTENAILLSIHQNTFPDSRFGGTQIFSDGKPGNRAFAEQMRDCIRAGLDPDNQREIKRLDVYLLKHVTCPAILVECGFLTHPADLARLNDPGYHKRLAVTLSAGLLSYAPEAHAKRTNEQSVNKLLPRQLNLQSGGNTFMRLS